MDRRQLAQLRWAVRAVLVLGVAASVAANVLHARPNPISQGIAAWPPLALLLTVELIARVPMHRRVLAAARIVATIAIAGIGAWVSYWHMAGVASRYGETGASPYLLPLSVDGLIIVTSVCLVELGGRLRDIPSPVVGPVHGEVQMPVDQVADRSAPSVLAPSAPGWRTGPTGVAGPVRSKLGPGAATSSLPVDRSGPVRPFEPVQVSGPKPEPDRADSSKPAPDRTAPDRSAPEGDYSPDRATRTGPDRVPMARTEPDRPRTEPPGPVRPSVPPGPSGHVDRSVTDGPNNSAARRNNAENAEPQVNAVGPADGPDQPRRTATEADALAIAAESPVRNRNELRAALAARGLSAPNSVLGPWLGAIKGRTGPPVRTNGVHVLGEA